MQDDSASNHYGGSNLRRSLGHFVLGKGVGAIIGVCWLLLLVRAVPASDYGIYVGFVAYLELFNLLSNLGLSPISEKYVPEYRSRNDEPHLRALILKLVSYRVLVVCLLSVVLATLAHTLAPLLGFGGAPRAFAIFQIVVAAESIARYVETVFDSLLLQGQSQVSLFSRTGIRLTFLLVALELGQMIELDQLVSLEASAYLCGLVVTFGLLWRTLHGLRSTSRASVALLPLVGFAMPIYGSQIVGSLIGVDVVKLLVLKTTGPEASAIFGFCASLAWMLQRYLPSFLLVGMVRPLIVSAAIDPAGGSRLQRIVSVILKLNAMLIGCALAVSLAVGDQMVSVLSGGKFSTGGDYLSLFLLFTLSQTLRATYGHVALARGRGRAMLLGQLSGAVILALGVLGSLVLGLYAFCMALVAIDLVWFAWVEKSLRVQGNSPAVPWSGLAKIAYLATLGWLIGSGLEYFMPAIWPIWLPVAIVSIAVGLVVVGLGTVIRPFELDERNAINSVLRKKIFIW